MNELIRITVGHFEPGDRCYEDVLLGDGGYDHIVEWGADVDIDDCYRLDKNWILEASNSFMRWGHSDIRVVLLQPVKVYAFEMMVDSYLGHEKTEIGLDHLFSRHLREIDALVEPLLRKKDCYPFGTPLAEAIRWGVVDTLWEADYRVYHSYEGPDEWDFDWDLLGRLNLNNPELVKLVEPIPNEQHA